MSGRLPYKTGVEHGSSKGVGSYDSPEYALALSANFSFIPATLKKVRSIASLCLCAYACACAAAADAVVDYWLSDVVACLGRI
eukprot:COSAG01_NODE_7700_length_3093_cov_1.525718_6_plen_83_part_00